jgi:hypothetical protein
LTPQLEGEELVSMGVTYWQIGEKDRALDLTLNGATLTQQSVDRGVLPKTSLAVPYGNLATMYKQLGQVGDAAKYAELARVAGAGEKPPEPTDSDDAKTTQHTSAKPNNQKQPRQMAGGNQNGAKPITVATATPSSAAQRARPGQPYNVVAQPPSANKTNQTSQSGAKYQASAGQEVARHQQDGQQDSQLSDTQMR